MESSNEPDQRARSHDPGEPAFAAADDPPGPRGLPVVGHTVSILRTPLEFLDRLASHGDVVRYRIAGNAATALFHPTDVQRVLVEDVDRFERYVFGDRGFDFAPEGILFNDGEQWHRQRTVMQPAFTVDRIESYASAMTDVARERFDEWADGQEVVLDREFSALTLEILGSALFDLELDPSSSDEPVVTAARLINNQSERLTFASFLPLWLPTPANRRYRRAMADYRERVDALIADRRERGTTGTDLLSLLLDAGESDGRGLSEDEIRDNLLTFLFAGHETTSLVLTYTVAVLSRHDRVRKRLDDELTSVLGDEHPRFEHVPDLEYTERVIREAMRLYPPSYIMFRTPTEDVTIGGYRVPAGSIVSLPQYRIHRDERFYDDPETFDPDRWTDDRSADRPEYAYFPFGGGPRHCMGMRFATLEATLVLATFAQRFDVELLEGSMPSLSPRATLQPESPVRARVRARG